MFILILPLAIGVSVLQLCNHDPRGRTLTFYYLINFLFFLLLLFFLYSFLPLFPFLFFFLSGRSLLPSSPLARVKIVARFSDPPFTLEKILKPSDLYTSLYYFSFSFCFSFFLYFSLVFVFSFLISFLFFFFFIFIFLNGSPLNVVPPPLSLLESLP